MYARTQNNRIALDVVRAVCSARARNFRAARSRAAAEVSRGLVGMSAGRWVNQVDMQDADLRALEVRGRVVGVFADSVVSDDEAGYPFRNRRERHLRGVDLHTCTSPRCVIGIRGGESSAWPFFDGPIDAPEWMASGASEWSWSPLERVSFVVRGVSEMSAALAAGGMCRMSKTPAQSLAMRAGWWR